MSKATSLAGVGLKLKTLKRADVPNVADQVFQTLQTHMLTLQLPPLARLSETEVAARLNVSRQPVREAFKRLARLGFLDIRPQSGTTVTLISEQAIGRARFIRTALESQTVRLACTSMSDADFAALAKLIARQKEAVAAKDRDGFHALDEQFHREICARAGVGYVWDLILDHKAHMDRVRMLTLNTSSQERALQEHVRIVDALKQRQPEAAAEAVAAHLSQIMQMVEQIKAENHEWFTQEAG